MTVGDENGQTIFLEDFEANCYAGRFEPAIGTLVKLLQILDERNGSFDDRLVVRHCDPFDRIDLSFHIVNRICSAIIALFGRGDLVLSDHGFNALLGYHQWIGSLFTISSFKNPDTIISAINTSGSDLSNVELSPKVLAIFWLAYSINSRVNLNLDVLLVQDPLKTIGLTFALLSPRSLTTNIAHKRRTELLQWLPSKVELLEDNDNIPESLVHNVYMQCSYSNYLGKHEIKKSINHLISRKLGRLEIRDVCREFGDYTNFPPREKPIMLVVLEWFTGNHSIYRTHSASIAAARQYFYVIGVGCPRHVDAIGASIFDEYIEASGDAVLSIRDLVERISPDIVYYPSIGMSLHTVYLSNLRLAPIQVMSYGHPASSMSEKIDYFLMPEDWGGEESHFSEKLIRFPESAMPFVPSSKAVKVSAARDQRDGFLRVAIATSTMKLNPAFLEALAKIATASNAIVDFCFFIGCEPGIIFDNTAQYIRQYLPLATTCSGQDYHLYLEGLASCDLYLNPFPFGNTNGIVDMASVGLVGVCKTGPEVLEHIDEALFRRAGAPEWLIASTVEDYITAAVKLIDETSLRLSLQQDLTDRGGDQIFYAGNPEKFGEMLAGLVTEKRGKALNECTEEVR